MTEWLSPCGTVRLICGDCLDVLPTLEAGSVDAVVTDPPYGLSFMGKHWDHGVPGEQFWHEVFRVAKPGCHLLAFGGTRTYHRLAVSIEDAGWEVRDCLGWIYGSGFPKSLDVSKAIDKAAGAKREVIGTKLGMPGYSLTDGKGGLYGGGFGANGTGAGECRITAPTTEAAKQWHGWGTALKPAWEPIILARKPLVGTVAANVLEHGTGGLNVDGCRIGIDEVKTQGGDKFPGVYGSYATCQESTHIGRWPANIVHDGSGEVLDILGEQSRFFYSAKASKADRDEGCERLAARARPTMGSGIGAQPDQQRQNNRNHHPTVKPTDLMRWLVRLITPPGGTVLDPFMGSGSTGKAAWLEGFRFIGIEREVEYFEIAKRRTVEAPNKRPLFDKPPAPQQTRELFDLTAETDHA